MAIPKKTMLLTTIQGRVGKACQPIGIQYQYWEALAPLFFLSIL